MYPTSRSPCSGFSNLKYSRVSSPKPEERLQIKTFRLSGFVNCSYFSLKSDVYSLKSKAEASASKRLADDACNVSAPFTMKCLSLSLFLPIK